MILDMNRAVIEIEYRGIVPVEDAVGTRIDCVRGRLWITEWGSADDILLEAGASYVISGGGLAVVQALRESLVGLRAPALRQAGAGSKWAERLWSQWARRGGGERSAIALLRPA
jgi:hypothetical protein